MATGLESGGRHVNEPLVHCAACAARIGECACANCLRCLRLITWYGQVPGNLLSRCIFPHRRQWERGIDWQALLRSKVFCTTAFTMRYVQWMLLLVALGELIAGISMLPTAGGRITRTWAKCAVARVTPHSLRNGHTVSDSINTSDWEFGLLSNKCSVPGGKLSVVGSARVLTFTGLVEFNGFYLTSHSAQSDFDPGSFTLECLSTSESSDTDAVRTLAASGSCGWFVGIKNVVVNNPPRSKWHTVQNALGENETRITLDYSDGQFSCWLPPLLDQLCNLISGGFFLVAAVQARYFTNSAIFGIKYPLQTCLLGSIISSGIAVVVCVRLWQPDYILMCLYCGHIGWSLLFLVSERFLEERIFLHGLYIAVLCVWASLWSFEGTRHTVFYNDMTSWTAKMVAPRCESPFLFPCCVWWCGCCCRESPE